MPREHPDLRAASSLCSKGPLLFTAAATAPLSLSRTGGRGSPTLSIYSITKPAASDGCIHYPSAMREAISGMDHRLGFPRRGGEPESVGLGGEHLPGMRLGCVGIVGIVKHLKQQQNRLRDAIVDVWFGGAVYRATSGMVSEEEPLFHMLSLSTGNDPDLFFPPSLNHGTSQSGT